MKKQSGGHRWSTEELLTLIGMWNEGVELDAIAACFKVTSHAINKQIARMRADGIAVPRRAAGHKAMRRNQPWSQSEVEFIVRRRNDRASAETIAIELGRSFLAVQAMIQKLRKEGVPVLMLGNGVRRKWDSQALIAAVAGRALVTEAA